MKQSLKVFGCIDTVAKFKYSGFLFPPRPREMTGYQILLGSLVELFSCQKEGASFRDERSGLKRISAPASRGSR